MSLPHHVAIIMDGNGRWAAQRGWIRVKGHKAGVMAVDRIVEAASRLGIAHLTLYAFSTENWQRPAYEVMTLMTMLRLYLRSFRNKFQQNGIRFHHLGDPEGLPSAVLEELRQLESATSNQQGLHFHLAVNYGSRRELVQAAARCLKEGLKPEDLDERSFASRLWTGGIPDVDLLIRTSGEFRISNFLLWQCAYAEFYVCETLWPDFAEVDLEKALVEFSRRQRRFGGL